MSRIHRATLPLLALGAAALGGCGDDDQAADPAALAPADSVFYAELVIRPEGEERDLLEPALSTLLDSDDPGAMIVEELNSSLAESGFSYEGDLAPWLGERGGLFLTALYPPQGDGAEASGSEAEDDGFSSDGVEGAFVVSSTDEESAGAFLEKLGAEADGAEDAEYEGVTYSLDDDGDAFGVVGEFVVFGSEQGFQTAVDTEAEGGSLAESEAYGSALTGAEGSIATLFADLPAIIAAAEAAGELSEDERATFDSFFGGVADQPLSASVDASAAGFGAELSYGATDAPFFGAAEESALLRELPGDSWFAAGFSGLGDAVGSLVENAEDFGIAEGEIDSTREQFRREFGLELEDFYEPFGDGAVFANGEGIFGTGGGLVVGADDPAAARRVLDGLVRAARRSGDPVRPLDDPKSGAEGFSVEIDEAPSTLNFVAGEDRIVIAYGEAATEAALDPESAEGSLGEGKGFGAAATALGPDYDIAAYLDFSPLVDLLGLAAISDPKLEAALPYLESLDFLISGSSSDGERERLRIFLGIAEAVAEPSA